MALQIRRVVTGHDDKGRANDILVLEASDPRFSDATLEAIREWRFKPRTTDSNAEDSVPVVRFLFTTGSVSLVPLTATARGTTRS